MTFKEFCLACDGYLIHLDNLKANSWYNAYLQRCDHKKFPSLKKFLIRKKPPTKKELEEMKENFEIMKHISEQKDKS
jgi:hypothetical protein